MAVNDGEEAEIDGIVVPTYVEMIDEALQSMVKAVALSL